MCEIEIEGVIRKPKEKGEATKDGLLLLQAYAKTNGAVGTVIVDIRRAGGGGGSLRAARASVSQATGVTHSHISMPIRESEQFFIYIIPSGSAPEPGHSAQLYYR